MWLSITNTRPGASTASPVGVTISGSAANRSITSLVSTARGGSMAGGSAASSPKAAQTCNTSIAIILETKYGLGAHSARGRTELPDQTFRGKTQVLLEYSGSLASFLQYDDSQHSDHIPLSGATTK